VPFERVSPIEALVARLTAMRSIPSVAPYVSREVVAALECHGAAWLGADEVAGRFSGAGF